VDGARANWGKVSYIPFLYDTLDWLATANANHSIGQWWVYKRYADQTDLRTNVATRSTHDALVFQDSSAKKSVTLLGKRRGGGTGTVTVKLNNIPSRLITSGSSNVLVERMASANACVSAPIVVSNSQETASSNSLSVAIIWSNALDTYVITLTS
jgi:hypothetical protein